MSRREALLPKRPSNHRRVLERDVLRACLDLLRAKHIWCERRNSGVMESASGKGRWVKFGEKGMADIQVLLPAERLRYRQEGKPGFVALTIGYDLAGNKELRFQKTLWIECKAGGGKQSYDQKLFQHIVEAEGHSYLLVNDVDQLAAWLRERGL